VSGEGGPFRGDDPVLSRLDKLIDTQGRHDNALGEVLKNTREPRVSAAATIAPWFGSPLLIVAIAYAGTLLFGTCDRGCAEDEREKRRTAQEAATAELHDHERYCAAVGMRFAGTTPVHQDPPSQSGQFTVQGDIYYSVVCGDGHGNGMFVGADGHLHALKEP